MKEIKLEDVNPLEAITNKMWSLFDLLRGELPSSDYHLILFLLSIYKDDYLDGVLSYKPEEIKTVLNEKLKNNNGVNHEKYKLIYPAFEKLVNEISNDGIHSTFQVLSTIKRESLKKHFSDVFDNVLYRIAKSQGAAGAGLILPIELSRFISSVAELPPNSSIYNPFAGVASFAVFFEGGQDYLGQEINLSTWAIGILRIMAYERPGNSNYVCTDSILNWPSQENKFDLIVSNPPFNLKVTGNEKSSLSAFRNVEQFLIDKGIDSLSNRGKLIAILPTGFLFRGGPEQKLRERIIEEDLLEAIISFPGGLLYSTGVPIVIMVLNKEKEKRDIVKFIDGKNFVESNDSRIKILNDYKLFSVIKSHRNSDHVVNVSNQKIRDYEYNLSVQRYFQKEYEGVQLSEILENIRGSRKFETKSGKLVKIRNLKDDKIDFLLNENEVELTELIRPNLRLIDESAILIALRWKTLKPTLFEFKNTPIFISNDIAAFRANQSLINVSYLINELQSDSVKEQFEAYSIGSAIPFIRKDDLLKLKINLPTLKEQDAKVQGLKEIRNYFVHDFRDNSNFINAFRNYFSSTIEKLDSWDNSNFTKDIFKILTNELNSKKNNEFLSLKHTLGRPRQNILDWTDNLIHFLFKKNEELEKLNPDFINEYGTDILSVLSEIKRDINFISEILEKGENGLVLNEYPLELISLTRINSIINEITHNGFKYIIRKLPLKGEKLKDRGIECNRLLLKTLIDNILTNADKHGFAKKDQANEVVIELIEIEDQLILEVKNNGKPFPNNFNKEKFINKFSSGNPQSGSGLGGYDIDRIAEYFKNRDWELILNSDPIYPVKFKFQFPIKPIQ